MAKLIKRQDPIGSSIDPALIPQELDRGCILYDSL